jgi:hypothetical protein
MPSLAGSEFGEIGALETVSNIAFSRTGLQHRASSATRLTASVNRGMQLVIPPSTPGPSFGDS